MRFETRFQLQKCLTLSVDAAGVRIHTCSTWSCLIPGTTTLVSCVSVQRTSHTSEESRQETVGCGLYRD
jgi:hypothetical protein